VEKKLTRRSMVTKMMQVGFITIASKAIGFFRQKLWVEYLGLGAIGDAFSSAYRIPSSLRKIFAEGALSASAVPTLVTVLKKDGKIQAGRVLSLILIFFQAVLLIGCIAVAFFAGHVMFFAAPGWQCADSEKCFLATKILRILIFYLPMVSASALIASVLQAAHLFSVPVMVQVLTNVFMVAELWVCLKLNAPVVVLAWCMLLNTVVLLGVSVGFYWYAGFAFGKPNAAAAISVRDVLWKFIPCAIGLGVTEINLFIDQQIASYLPDGSISLLNNTYAFTRVPLGIFAITFSTVLLPHFSRVVVYAPRRLSFYLLESTKFIWWVTVPISILMGSLSLKMFFTLFSSPHITALQGYQFSNLFNIFIISLFFLSLDKIVLNMFYALHETFLPVFATFISALLNTLMSVALMPYLGIQGIVLSTVLASIFKLGLCIWALKRKFGFVLYPKALGNFLVRTLVQFSILGALLYLSYDVLYFCIMQLPGRASYLLLFTMLYWFWVIPLCLVFAGIAYYTRRLFGIRMHFLD